VADAKRRGSGFEVFDRSTPESLEQECHEALRARIGRADQFVVLCGEWTHRAEGVATELRIAQELEKPYFFLKGRHIDSSRPSSARISDKLYQWNSKGIDGLIRGFR
jgi:hypothetical protein